MDYDKDKKMTEGEKLAGDVVWLVGLIGGLLLFVAALVWLIP